MVSGFRCLIALLFGAAWSLPVGAQPESAQTPAERLGVTPNAAASDTVASDAPATKRARRHFKNGVKLYRDANYPGALAEFEAAYREKPGPGSLQNVALCLKALFRYTEAADVLRLLIARHAADLSPGEQEAMRAAVTELESLVGTLIVSVQPPNASVSLNGRVLTPEQRANGVRLNVGEHALVVEAPGYSRRAEVVRVASQQRLPVEVKLQPTGGFLEIVSSDPKAAIAIDNEPLAYGSWSGPVVPGDHLIQVYRDGFEPFERSVRVELGRTLRVSGELGPATGDAVDERPLLPGKPAAPPAPRAPVGFYALASVSVVGLTNAPLDLRVSGTDANLSLPSFGARGGYRLSESIAVEAMIDYGQLDAEGACEEVEGDEACVFRDFSLRSLRFGPNLKLMTRGERLRFTIGIGAGVTGHWLELEPAEGRDGGNFSGADPYFNLELGVGYNYRHLLAELAVIAYIDGVSELRGDINHQRVTAFEDGTLPMLGVGLKLGYSAWAPR